MRYTIQCKDQDTGQTGCFGFDPAKGHTANNFHAITPVFGNLQDFYLWAHGQEIELDHYTHGAGEPTDETMRLRFDL
jgi:hypothetical protein